MNNKIYQQFNNDLDLFAFGLYVYLLIFGIGRALYGILNSAFVLHFPLYIYISYIFPYEMLYLNIIY